MHREIGEMIGRMSRSWNFSREVNDSDKKPLESDRTSDASTGVFEKHLRNLDAF
jgi:hypothetical protein